MNPSQKPQEPLTHESAPPSVTLSDLLIAMTFADAWEVAGAADPPSRAMLQRAGFDDPELN